MRTTATAVILAAATSPSMVALAYAQDCDYASTSVDDNAGDNAGATPAGARAGSR